MAIKIYFCFSCLNIYISKITLCLFEKPDYFLKQSGSESDYFLKQSGSEYEIYFILTINLQENRFKRFVI